jgi:hypothetical protein
VKQSRIIARLEYAGVHRVIERCAGQREVFDSSVTTIAYVGTDPTKGPQLPSHSPSNRRSVPLLWEETSTD